MTLLNNIALVIGWVVLAPVLVVVAGGLIMLLAAVVKAAWHGVDV